MADGLTFTDEVDDDHDYTPEELAAMPTAELVRLLQNHQQQRWLARLTAKHTVKAVSALYAHLVEARMELESERREVAKLRQTLNEHRCSTGMEIG